MGKERDKRHHSEQEHDPYWQFDEAISEAEIHGERYGIRLGLHTSKERYSEREELVAWQAVLWGGEAMIRACGRIGIGGGAHR